MLVFLAYLLIFGLPLWRDVDLLPIVARGEGEGSVANDTQPSTAAERAVTDVLDGAMSPLGFERSDGLQNLTESLMAARVLGPGVWLVMHSQVFAIERTRKDRERATFVAIAES